MVDTGIRAQARKDLRDYDNPKGGNNPNYGNNEYLLTIIRKYGVTNESDLRIWANSAKHKRQHR